MDPAASALCLAALPSLAVWTSPTRALETSSPPRTPLSFYLRRAWDGRGAAWQGCGGWRAAGKSSGAGLRRPVRGGCAGGAPPPRAAGTQVLPPPRGPPPLLELRRPLLSSRVTMGAVLGAPIGIAGSSRRSPPPAAVSLRPREGGAAVRICACGGREAERGRRLGTLRARRSDAWVAEVERWLRRGAAEEGDEWVRVKAAGCLGFRIMGYGFPLRGLLLGPTKSTTAFWPARRSARMT